MLNSKPASYAMETDDAQLHSLIAHLSGVHNIPGEQIFKEHFILISRWDYSVIGVYKELAQSDLKGTVQHHPDIIVRDRHGSLKYVIELDGSIHHTKPGAKKTAKRNANYKLANMPFIAIDILDLKALGVSWFDYLDEEMKKMPRVVEELPEPNIVWK